MGSSNNMNLVGGFNLPTPLKNMFFFSNGLQWLMVVNGWLMDAYYNIIYLVGGFNQPL